MSIVALLRSCDLVQLSLKCMNLLLLCSNLLIFNLNFLELQLLSYICLYYHLSSPPPPGLYCIGALGSVSDVFLFFLILEDHFQQLSGWDIIFSRPHMSENVSVFLLYRSFGQAENSQSEIIFSQNFANIVPLFSFFSVAVETSDAQKIFFHYFETFFFPFLEAQRIFSPRVLKFLYYVPWYRSFLKSISLEFRVVLFRNSFPQFREVSLNNFFF